MTEATANLPGILLSANSLVDRPLCAPPIWAVAAPMRDLASHWTGLGLPYVAGLTNSIDFPNHPWRLPTSREDKLRRVRHESKFHGFGACFLPILPLILGSSNLQFQGKMRSGWAVDETFQAQAPQIVGHLGRRVGSRLDSQQVGLMTPEIAVAEALDQLREQAQRHPQSHSCPFRQSFRLQGA
jgi:hypothetical protein